MTPVFLRVFLELCANGEPIPNLGSKRSQDWNEQTRLAIEYLLKENLVQFSGSLPPYQPTDRGLALLARVHELELPVAVTRWE